MMVIKHDILLIGYGSPGHRNDDVRSVCPGREDSGAHHCGKDRANAGQTTMHSSFLESWECPECDGPRGADARVLQASGRSASRQGARLAPSEPLAEVIEQVLQSYAADPVPIRGGIGREPAVEVVEQIAEVCPA